MIRTRIKPIIYTVLVIHILTSLHAYADNVFDFFDSPESQELLDTADITTLLNRRCTLTPQFIVAFLVQAGIIPVLEEDFYLRTNNLNTRSLLDLPTFEPICSCETGKKWAVGFTAFYNQTTRMFYTADSDKLSSYIALCEETILQKIETALEPFIPDLQSRCLDVDFREIFRIFSNMAMQQRRTGFMIHGERQKKDWHIRFFFPLYYQELNYFLSPEEEDEIAREFGATSQAQEKDFDDTHFISDKLGFGDTRIEIDKKWIKRNSFVIRGGIMSTLPTAFAFKKGIRGRHFEKTSCQPPATIIHDLVCIAFDPDLTEPEKLEAALELLRVFGLGALDRLSAMLIEKPLGNEGHFGLGLLLRTKAKASHWSCASWASRAKWCNRFSAEYLFPAKNKRFYIPKNNAAEFNQRDFTNTDQAVDNLAFLEQTLVDRIYPRAFSVTVRPGMIFRWDSRCCYQGKLWGGTIGTDYWLQTAERQHTIHGCPEIVDDLNKAKAQSSLAQQLKLYGSMRWRVPQCTRTWFLSLNVDYTIFNTGIGQDFTLSFNAETHF
jgi:hypothetical protein